MIFLVMDDLMLLILYQLFVEMWFYKKVKVKTKKKGLLMVVVGSLKH